MNTLTATAILSYFWFISRILPNYAAKRALKLMFTVDKTKAQSKKIPKADIVTRLPDGSHLHVWKGESDKSVLLIHGWNGSFDHFQTLFPLLRDRSITIYGVAPLGYGKSNEMMSNPKLFINAIKHACKLIPRPVNAAVGHSMGAGALAIAASEIELNPQTDMKAKDIIANKLVLISSPASFLEVIERFANALRLSTKATMLFTNKVEELVGKHEEVEVVNKVKSSTIPSLVIHDRYDKQIPFKDAQRLVNTSKIATLYQTEQLGHTRILFNSTVCDKILMEIE
ncbi:MAG: hypothetical protein AXW14_14660 [Alteromonas sp. Nap_26]|nr:MAG: hypothetical protein AXW14_14660 [Alteromonas sp. Nap_26]